jgi:hypothetical protein
MYSMDEETPFEIVPLLVFISLVFWVLWIFMES